MCKSRREFQKSKLDEIGKRKYDFDFFKERNVYSYLSCYKMTTKSKKSIIDLKFDSYREWKDYVEKKYEGYDNDKLEEFNRYLNLRIRNVKKTRSYWDIIIPVLLAVFMDPVFEILISIFASSNIDLGVVTGLFELINIVLIATSENLIALTIFVTVIVSIIFYFIEPLSMNNVDYYFLTDYKEIVEHLIKKETEDKKPIK